MTWTPHPSGLLWHYLDESGRVLGKVMLILSTFEYRAATDEGDIGLFLKREDAKRAVEKKCEVTV